VPAKAEGGSSAPGWRIGGPGEMSAAIFGNCDKNSRMWREFTNVSVLLPKFTKYGTDEGNLGLSVFASLVRVHVLMMGSLVGARRVLGT